jgi:hypothetical protein
MSHVSKAHDAEFKTAQEAFAARPVKGLVSLPVEGERELRKLRVYNWQLVLRYRGHARRLEASGLYTSRAKAKEYNRKANLALRAVQALNCVLSGTAEQDLAEMGEVTW